MDGSLYEVKNVNVFYSHGNVIAAVCYGLGTHTGETARNL